MLGEDLGKSGIRDIRSDEDSKKVAAMEGASELQEETESNEVRLINLTGEDEVTMSELYRWHDDNSNGNANARSTPIAEGKDAVAVLNCRVRSAS